ncbi:phosphatidylinositol mannoside acyltransferase [soil metagenome]
MAPSVAYSAYRLGSLLSRAAPEPVALAFPRVAGTLAARVLQDRRVVVERNLRRVHGDGFSGTALRRAVDETFTSYARYWIESFRLPGLSPTQLDARFTSEGLEHLDAARAAGTGAILAVPHLGGWEWAAFWLTTVREIPITAVVEPVEPPELYRWFVAFRRSLGMEIVPLGPSAGTDVMRGLREGRVASLLSDRDIGGGGVEVEFFGERTTLPGGPATLALRTGVPLLPAAVYFDGPGHCGKVCPPLAVERHGRLRDDVTRITQDLAHALEELIRAAPDQWHLLQPNWPSDHAALAGSHRRLGRLCRGAPLA